MNLPPVATAAQAAQGNGSVSTPPAAPRQRAWLGALGLALRSVAPRPQRRKVLVGPAHGLPLVPTHVQVPVQRSDGFGLTQKPGDAPAPAAEARPASVRESLATVADALALREPIRWHAEWTAAGVRLWLGTDVQGLDAGKIGLVIGVVVRQLEARGVLVAGVVWNGREVRAEPAPPDVVDREEP